MTRTIKFNARYQKESYYWDKEHDKQIILNLLENPKKYIGVQFFQFTGLKDKNEKEIYEGDIVNISIPMSIRKKDATGVVLFNAGLPGFQFLNSKTSKKPPIDRTAHAHDMFSLGRFGGRAIKVIGNKFENPELIEKK